MRTFIIGQWEKGLQSNHPFNRHTIGLSLAAGLVGGFSTFFIGLLFV